MKTIEEYYDIYLTKKFGKNDYSKETALFGSTERKANQDIIKILTTMAAITLIIWIMCLSNVFNFGSYRLELYILPINMIVLTLPHVFSRTKIVNYTNYKYYLLTLLTLVIFVINVVLPKHGILGWPLVVVFASHYHSPKTIKFAFATAAILMLGAIYLGMLFGEWDSNLLLGSYHTINGVNPEDYTTAAQRWDYLIETKNIIGENRFFTAFLYYYLPRFSFLSVITMLCISLCERGRKLIYDQAIIVAEVQKNETELSFATDIQVNSLPTNFAIEGHDEVDVFASTRPAKQVGGDFYDFYLTDDNHMIFLIADVSGKGVPAALFMMQARTTIKSLAYENHTINELVNISNERLCSNNSAELFVTCWIGELDLTTGEVNFVNAGHNFPLIKKASGVYKYLEERHGMPLAAMEGRQYRTGSFKLEKGDSIFLYTDGVTEATDPKNRLYGDDRLHRIINSYKGDSSKEIVDYINNDVDTYANGADQADDITVLAIKRN